jgi:hypothetical protein
MLSELAAASCVLICLAEAREGQRTIVRYWCLWPFSLSDGPRALGGHFGNLGGIRISPGAIFNFESAIHRV